MCRYEEQENDSSDRLLWTPSVIMTPLSVLFNPRFFINCGILMLLF